MRIAEISLEDYRNLGAQTVAFSRGVNIICGKNAQGKTNLLESIWLFTGGRSFRGSKDFELIGFGKQQASVTAKICSKDIKDEVKIEIYRGTRSAFVNGISRGRASSLIGEFRCVIFSPEHLCIVKGSPEGRRKLIDTAICQLKPAYAAAISRYNQVLRSRNALLRQALQKSNIPDSLDVWDIKLCEYGARILHERMKYIEEMKPLVSSAYAGISGNKEEMTISYNNNKDGKIPDIKDIEKDISRRLFENRKRDLASGSTSVGPHRDELEISLDNLPARNFGSQGQCRSCVLAIKTAEAELVKKFTGEPPVILLDDVMSELDGGRREYVSASICGCQTFITGCETPEKFKADCIFNISDGVIEKA